MDDKKIIQDLIAATKNKELPVDFRRELRGILVDIREEIEAIIIQYDSEEINENDL